MLFPTSSTEGKSCGPELPFTVATAYAINWEQLHQKQQVAHANYQLTYGQNVNGQVNQIIDTSEVSPACWPTESPACWPTESPACWPTESPACWPTESPAGWPTESPAGWPTESPAGWPTESPAGWPTESPAGWPTESPAGWPTESPAGWPTESPVSWSSESAAFRPAEAPVGVQDVAGHSPANVLQLEGMLVSSIQGVQVQSDQVQQNISNAQSLQNLGIYPNLMATDAVSSTFNYQQIDVYSPIQTVDAVAEISTHQLQKLPDDPNKWHNVAIATNPATMSTPNKHCQVNEYVNPDPCIAATATNAKLTKSQTSNFGLNAHQRTQRNAYTYPYCTYPDDKSESKKKLICHIPACTRVFKKAYQPQAHIRSHTDKRPFVCGWVYCGKRFIHFVDFLRHINTHVGEKKFQCLKTFSHRRSLSYHLKTRCRNRTIQLPT